MIWKTKVLPLAVVNRLRQHFCEADFRRIYGVVFRILLYGEATVYLLFVGTVGGNFHNDHYSLNVMYSCGRLIRNAAQEQQSDK